MLSPHDPEANLHALSSIEVVLYETDAQGRLKIRLDDLQEAVKQWLQTRPADI